MRRLPWLLLALTGMAHAQAATVTVSWSNPTTNVDGSAIGTISGTRVEYGSCSSGAFGIKAGETITTGAVTSATFTLAPATYCFRAYTRTASGESGPSNVASKTVTAPLPSPPTLTTVAVAVYDVRWQGGTFVASRQVGTIALGTDCEASVSAPNGFYGVPRSAVTLTKSPKSTTLVAQCG